MSRFVGVGVSDYSNGPKKLERAGPGVEAVAVAFGDGWQVLTAELTSKDKLEELLKQQKDTAVDGQPLVLVWSGHGRIHSGTKALELLASDSPDEDDEGLPVSKVVSRAVRSGAGQLLIVLDCCFSGDGAPAAVEVATNVMDARPRRPTSCGSGCWRRRHRGPRRTTGCC